MNKLQKKLQDLMNMSVLNKILIIGAILLFIVLITCSIYTFTHCLFSYVITLLFIHMCKNKKEENG